MTRRAGYPGMAVRPDESILPKREVSFFICYVPEAAQPRISAVVLVYIVLDLSRRARARALRPIHVPGYL